jgi:methylase of polypeptide subunit release factors
MVEIIRKLKPSGKLACDMGTGSGILARELAGKFRMVVAVDINPGILTLDFPENVRAVRSDLFGKVREKNFELIVFNSPYLPGAEDARWSCGDGSLLVKFLERAKGKLAKGGRIIFLISSLTPEIVQKRARGLFSVEILAEKRLPGFETLFVLGLRRGKRATS